MKMPATYIDKWAAKPASIPEITPGALARGQYKVNTIGPKKQAASPPPV